ncbi:hypothetical protein CC2G_001871 [Coprinopsis cinerea AmutBmut pab1-1]|nr:hypothetical protein CC2G_001871 [Coprinopsis cinerea AmutBmut pab1-1]
MEPRVLYEDFASNQSYRPPSPDSFYAQNVIQHYNRYGGAKATSASSTAHPPTQSAASQYQAQFRTRVISPTHRGPSIAQSLSQAQNGVGLGLGFPSKRPQDSSTPIDAVGSGAQRGDEAKERRERREKRDREKDREKREREREKDRERRYRSKDRSTTRDKERDRDKKERRKDRERSTTRNRSKERKDRHRSKERKDRADKKDRSKSDRKHESTKKPPAPPPPPLEAPDTPITDSTGSEESSYGQPLQRHQNHPYFHHGYSEHYDQSQSPDDVPPHARPDLGKLSLGSGPLHPGLNPNSPHNYPEVNGGALQTPDQLPPLPNGVDAAQDGEKTPTSALPPSAAVGMSQTQYEWEQQQEREGRHLREPAQMNPSFTASFVGSGVNSAAHPGDQTADSFGSLESLGIPLGGPVVVGGGGANRPHLTVDTSGATGGPRGSNVMPKNSMASFYVDSPADMTGGPADTTAQSHPHHPSHESSRTLASENQPSRLVNQSQETNGRPEPRRHPTLPEYETLYPEAADYFGAAAIPSQGPSENGDGTNGGQASNGAAGVGGFVTDMKAAIGEGEPSTTTNGMMPEGTPRPVSTLDIPRSNLNVDVESMGRYNTPLDPPNSGQSPCPPGTPGWPSSRLSALLKVPSETLVQLLVRAEEEAEAYKRNYEVVVRNVQEGGTASAQSLAKAQEKIDSLKSRLKSKEREYEVRLKETERRAEERYMQRLKDYERRISSLSAQHSASLSSLTSKYTSQIAALEKAKREQSLTLSSKILDLQSELSKLNSTLSSYNLKLEHKEREVERAREVVRKLEEEKDEMSREVVKAKGQVRRVREEAFVRVAMEEGRREGFEEGVRKGRVGIALARGTSLPAPAAPPAVEASGSKDGDKKKSGSASGSKSSKGKGKAKAADIDSETAIELLEIEKAEKDRLAARIKDLEELVKSSHSQLRQLESQNTSLIEAQRQTEYEERRRLEDMERRNQERLDDIQRRNEERLMQMQHMNELRLAELERGRASEVGSVVSRMRELEDEVERERGERERLRREEEDRRRREEEEKRRRDEEEREKERKRAEEVERLKKEQKELEERLKREKEEREREERERKEREKKEKKEREEKEKKEKEERERKKKEPTLPYLAMPPPPQPQPQPQPFQGVPRPPSTSASRRDHRRRDSGSDTSEIHGFDILTFPSVPDYVSGGYPSSSYTAATGAPVGAPVIPGFPTVSTGYTGYPGDDRRGLSTIHENRTPSPLNIRPFSGREAYMENGGRGARDWMGNAPPIHNGSGPYGNPTGSYTGGDGLLVPPPNGGNPQGRGLRHEHSSSTVNIDVVPPSRPPSSLQHHPYTPSHPQYLSPNAQPAPLPVPAPAPHDRRSPDPSTYVPVIPAGFRGAVPAPTGSPYGPYDNPTMPVVPPPQPRPPGWTDTRPNSPYDQSTGLPVGFHPQSVTPAPPNAMPEPSVDGLPVEIRKKKKKGRDAYGNPNADQVGTSKMGPAAMRMPEPTSSIGAANMSMPAPSSALGPASMAMPEPGVPVVPPPRPPTSNSAAGGGTNSNAWTPASRVLGSTTPGGTMVSMPEPGVPNIVPSAGTRTPAVGAATPLGGSTMGPGSMAMPEPTVGGGAGAGAGGSSPYVGATAQMPEPTVPNIVPGKKGKKGRKASMGGAGGAGGSSMAPNAGSGMPDPVIPSFAPTPSAPSPNRLPSSMPEPSVTDYTGGTGITRTPNPGPSPALPAASAVTPHLATAAMPEPEVVDFTGGGRGGSGSGGGPSSMPEPTVVDYTGTGKKKGKKSKSMSGPVIPPSQPDEEEEEEEEGFIPPLSALSASNESQRGNENNGNGHGGGGGKGGWGWGSSWGIPSVFGGGNSSSSPQTGGGGGAGAGEGGIFGGASTSPHVGGGGMTMPSPHMGTGGGLGGPTFEWDTTGGQGPPMPGGVTASPHMGPYGNPTTTAATAPVIPPPVDNGDDEDAIDPQTAMNTAMNSASEFLGVPGFVPDVGKKKKKKGRKG